METQSARISPVNPLRRFASPELEVDYRRYLFENSHTQVWACCWIAVMMLVSIAVFLDSYYFQSPVLERVRAARLMSVLPLGIVALSTRLLANYRLVFIAAAIAVLSLAWTLYGFDLARDEAFFSYYYLLSLPLTLLTYTLYRVEYRLGLWFSLPVTLLIVLAMLQLNLPLEERSVLIFGLVSIGITLVATMYSRERSEREQFLLDQSTIEDLERQAQADRERAQWYQTFSQFLRHELSTYLVGIRTSFELIDRLPEQRDAFIERGQQSLGEMQALMRQAAEATSIDEALKVEERERFSLSDVLNDCVDEYTNAYTEVRFDTSVAEGLNMEGQAYRIRQLMDKLVSNAVRHQDGQQPIAISVKTDADRAQVIVTNSGDPLPADTDIFDLWTKGERDSSDRRHGLGLYVARKIAEAHGGSILGETVAEPCGARFTVELPLA